MESLKIFTYLQICFMLFACALKHIGASPEIDKYPYVLPKCCVTKRNPYSQHTQEFNECGNKTELRSVIFLHRTLFHSNLEHSQSIYVEAELRIADRELICPHGLNEESFAINLVQNGTLSFVPEFNDVRFAGNQLIIPGRFIYPPDEYCVYKRQESNVLDIRTCTKECSFSNPCVPRCCEDYQNTFYQHRLGFLNTCANVRESWKPLKSKILNFEINTTFSTVSQIMRPPVLETNCWDIKFTEKTTSNKKPLITILLNGSLVVEFTDTTIVRNQGEYCIDGVLEQEKKDQIISTEIEQVETVFIKTCSESNNNLTPGSFVVRHFETEDMYTLSACSGYEGFDVFELPKQLFWGMDSDKEDELTILVKLKNILSPFECQDGYTDTTLDLSKKDDKEIGDISFLKDGLLNFEGITLGSNEFCVKSVTESEMTIQSCTQKCSSKRPCINRCCGRQEQISLAKFLANENFTMTLDCERLNVQPANKWIPLFYMNPVDTHPISSVNYDPIMKYKDPIPSNFEFCQFFTTNRDINSELLPALPFKFLQNGSLMEKQKRKKWLILDPNSYCIEPYWVETGFPKKLHFSGNVDDIIIKRCYGNETGLDQENFYVHTRPELMATFYFTFSLFYAGIAVVFFLRKDKEPVFRWSIIFCSFYMTLAYIFFGYSRIAFYFHYREEDGSYFTVCAFIAIAGNFISINGRSWMTTLSFDLWFTFTFLSPKKKSMRRLWFYISFTHGVALVIVGTGVTLDVNYMNDIFTDIVYPEYGVSRCLFDAGDAAFAYFFGPLIVLTSINVIFFATTTYTLWRAKQSSNFTKSTKESYENRKKSFLLYTKLFLFMGLPWILEYLEWSITELNKPVPLWANIIELINIVQPAFVFYFLVCTSDTKQYLVGNYPKLGVLSTQMEKLRASCLNPCKPSSNLATNGGPSTIFYNEASSGFTSGTNETPVPLNSSE